MKKIILSLSFLFVISTWCASAQITSFPYLEVFEAGDGGRYLRKVAPLDEHEENVDGAGGPLGIHHGDPEIGFTKVGNQLRGVLAGDRPNDDHAHGFAGN